MGIGISAIQEQLRRITAKLRKVLNDRAIFSALIENSPDFISIADESGKPVYVNPAGRQMVGFPHETPVQSTDVTEYYPPETRGFVNDTIMQGMKTEGRWHGETNFRNWETGQSIPVLDEHFIIRDHDDNHVLGYGTVTRDITELKRAQEASREFEAISTGILAVSADAIISLDQSLQIKMFNAAAEKIFGYRSDEVMGKPIEMLLPERFRAVHVKNILAFAQGPVGTRNMGEPGKIIYGLRKGDIEFPSEATISKTEVGGKRFITVALRDITERVRIQEDVQRSRERFDLALRGADLGAWDWNIQTGDFQFNPHWAEMRGYRVDEMKTHVDSWLNNVHPDDLSIVHKALNDHFEGKTPEYEAEHRVRTKSGEWIWILDRGKVFTRDNSGRPVRMVGTELEITERKHDESVERFLAELSELFVGKLDFETVKAIAELMVREFADFCAIDLIDDDGTFQRFTVASRNPEKNWIGEGLVKLIYDRNRRTFSQESVQNRKPVVLEEVTDEHLLAYAQTPEHLLLLTATEMHSVVAAPLNAHGKLLGALVFAANRPTPAYDARDVRLAEEIARRTALFVENVRLYRAAERAIQARDDVLGVVAHDLRNPLGTLIMHIALLKSPTTTLTAGIQAKALDGMQRSAHRMNRLIQDLLDVTKLESGSLVIQPAPVEVQQLLGDVLETQGSLAAAAKIDLILDVPVEIPLISADRNRLLQIFENLVGNALKFTPVGGRIILGAEVRHTEILFRVEDTGCGIPAENVPRIFDRFWQAQKAQHGGAGLGLSIVKGLVEAHHGRIWAESIVGTGTKMFFTIPTTQQSALDAVRSDAT